MNVTINNEYKTYLVYETEKFSFKISQGTLDKQKEKRTYPTNMQRKIQKGLKLKTNILATGAEWEEAYKSIYEKIIEEDEPEETSDESEDSEDPEEEIEEDTTDNIEVDDIEDEDD